MSTVLAAGRRVLPRGYGDFGLQLLIWLGFYFGYLAVRGVVDRNPAKAFVNGLGIIGFEQRWFGYLFEQTAQRIADSSDLLMKAAAYTYWNSEFTVIGLTLLFVYVRRHDRFAEFRNTILLANMIGLVGYVLVPTAPPWMFSSYGFVAGVDRSSGLVSALANPYAAMPSLHSTDALIVAVFMIRACRSRWAKALWALWPGWVWFTVMATANHYVLDVVAGIAVAIFAIWATGRVGAHRKRAIVAV